MSVYHRCRTSADRAAGAHLVSVLLACWYLIAAPAVLWPSRAISSANVAPADAARTAPVCRRSWNRRSGRPALARASYQPQPYMSGVLTLPRSWRGEVAHAVGGGEQQPLTVPVDVRGQGFLTAETTCGGIAASVERVWRVLCHEGVGRGALG